VTHAHILVLEPDILLRHPLAEYLRACGYRVLEASNATQALVFLTEGPHPIDVVLADIDAAEKEVFALATWLRHARPGTEVVLAGTATAAVTRAGELCEAGSALNKPYDHQLLLERIRRLAAARDRSRAS
jgi:DNA-binding response OmpR family regulator